MGELEPKEQGHLFTANSDMVQPGEFWVFSGKDIKPEEDFNTQVTELNMAAGFTLADKFLTTGIIMSFKKIGRDTIILINKAWGVIFPDNYIEGKEDE